MGQKLSCNIVRDLLPNYVERLSSEETNESIREHLKECPTCMDVYLSMTEHVDGEGCNRAPEVKEFKSFLNYTRFQILSSVLYGAGILAIIVCFIVNIALDRKLTWSLLAAGGIVLLLLPLFVGRSVGKRRLECAYGCMAVLLLPYLKLIEVVTNRYFLPSPEMWFCSIALPVSILWIVVVAFIFWLVKKIRWKNLWFLLAGLLILCLAASILTQLYIMRYYPDDMSGLDVVVSGFGTTAAAAVCFVKGLLAEHKRKAGNS